MEEPLKYQQPSLSSGISSKLRYPLRSAAKSKDLFNKSSEFLCNPSLSTLKRERTSSMSKSVSVLELSGKDKEKSAKPPRRVSIPAKSSATPKQKSTSNGFTPISEARPKRMANGQERCICETLLSDVSRSCIRKKFNILSSASYWLSQIKLSESADKHLISLGFFKLALEAGNEPMQRLREELKSYVQRHNLTEMGETVRGLFESYEISETMEQLEESVICSNVPEDASTLSSEYVQRTSSTAGTKKLKPKSLTDTQASSKKGNAQKVTPVTKIRASVSFDPVKPRVNTESGRYNIKKKFENLGKDNSNKVDKPTKQHDKTVAEVTNKSLDMKETLEGNKETWMVHGWER